MRKVRPAVHALVPVKPLKDSKLRLADILGPAERAKLTLLMLDDVLANLAASAEMAGLAVVSSDPDVLDVAVRRNAQPIPEPDRLRQTDDALNRALVFAAQQLGEGVAVLVVPGDVPLVGCSDYSAMINGWHEGVTAVRAHDGGTNALLSLSSDAMPYQFGQGSLAHHRAAAQALGLPFQVVENPVWSRDIDSPADLAWLAQHRGQCASAEFADQLLRTKDALKRSA